MSCGRMACPFFAFADIGRMIKEKRLFQKVIQKEKGQHGDGEEAIS